TVSIEPDTTKQNKKTVKIGDKIRRYEAACPLCGLNIWGVGTLSKHFTSRHSNEKLWYVCRKCSKQSTNCHPIACHVPKCVTTMKSQKVVKIARFTFDNKVVFNSIQFATTRGVSQHMRHTHPSEWNNHKIAELKNKNAAVNGEGSWRSEEHDIITRMMRENSEQGASPRTPMTPQERIREKYLENMLDNMAGKKGRVARSIIKMVMNGDANGVTSNGNVEMLATAMGKRKKIKVADNSRLSMVTGAKTSKWKRVSKINRYRSYQILYENDQGTLANTILDGKENLKCNIPMVDLHATFCDRWQRKSVYKGLGPFRSIRGAMNDGLRKPILPKEVMGNLNKMKNGSAPGPDGITKKSILNWDVCGVALAVEFTRWLLHGTIPSAVKECTTSLLPKSTNPDDLKDVSNWRPITTGSMLFAQACPMNPRQRGFLVDANGKKPLAVLFIDFAKAFDSVTHDHILSSPRKRGVDRHIWGLIKNAYVRCTTKIYCGKDTSETIQMQVGVKQGDPMSPLLFNLAKDPLIQYLEDSNWGLGMNGRKMSALAFMKFLPSDDLVLVSGSRDAMCNLLESLERFCKLTGLSHGLLNAGDPWKGIVPPELKEDMARWLQNIKMASIKPSQRLTILNTYAVPRIIYKAAMGKTPITYLVEIDRMIRTAIKKWLHLALMTNNGLLYSRTRDGGLGVIRLEKLVPCIKMKCIWKMCWSEVDWTKSIAREQIEQPEWDRLWKTLGVPGQATKPDNIYDMEGDCCSAKTINIPNWRDRENLMWELKGTYSKGVSLFWNDKISDTWLKDPQKVSFEQKDYLMGLALRSGITPVVISRRCANTHMDSTCRRCNAKHEWLSHILGQCEYVKHNIIRCHNKICDNLQEEMVKHKWNVIREMRLIDDNVRNGLVLIIDVTVRYETSDFPLELAAEEKVKYMPIGGKTMHMLCAKDFKILGFPIGSRGKWPKYNDTVLQAIGIPEKRRTSFTRFLSRRVLLYSIDVIEGFYKD
uniref:Reverse transcriptase domain-containing protein n=1 Tax=Hippocampus comes TaxID=109280 RepID=A0A3Q2XM41_HIPCM